VVSSAALRRACALRASWLVAVLTFLGASARAQAPASEDEATLRARDAFVAGAELARETRWGDALARFEESARLRAHATTTFNIGVCLRALGHYTRARSVLRRALEQNDAAGGADLAPSLIESIGAYDAEIERLLASVEVTVEPRAATIAVDGRPLAVQPSTDGLPTLAAGILAPGKGKRPPRATFRLVLDPGTHLVTISHKGFSDAVVPLTVTPGERRKLRLGLARLPATLRIAASERRAAVALDGVDVGLAPLDLERPPGRYRVTVQKEGYERYETAVTLRPAERSNLMAKLAPESPGIHERWWFWTTLAGVAASAAVTVYVVTRPEPERPPPDGGGLGWTIPVP
jgi:hypothetical protein